MEANWASEHLQTIRTLMERSALYRRALAPIMMLNGIIGTVAAAIPCGVPIQGNRAFSAFWMAVSLAGVVGSYLLVRRQALREAEPFWSPPTRRVTESLAPAFLIGLLAGFLFIIQPAALPPLGWLLAVVWTVTYGTALHAAGFFMQRGIKWLGWVFMLGGLALLLAAFYWPGLRTPAAGHYIMGVFFGVLQLAYSIYLYFTEKRRKTA